MPPNYAIITERELEGFKIIEVDTSKATYQGRPWRSLGDWAKRKFDNSLAFEKLKGGLKVKVTYK